MNRLHCYDEYKACAEIAQSVKDDLSHVLRKGQEPSAEFFYELRPEALDYISESLAKARAEAARWHKANDEKSAAEVIAERKNQRVHIAQSERERYREALRLDGVPRCDID